MTVVGTLLHRFVSPVPDAGETNIVGPSEWNEEHIFSGGQAGYNLYWDASVEDRASFKHPPFYDIKEDYRAVGDGNTDDTAAFQDALNVGGMILVSPGVYNITGPLTMTQPALLLGMGSFPGSDTVVGTSSARRAVLEHNFNGNFITILGVPGTSDASSGYSLQNLVLRQAYGNGTVTSGVAISILGSNDAYKPGDICIEKVQIVTGAGKDAWSWGIFQDGNGTTTKLVDTLIRDVRIFTGPLSTASIGVANVQNWRLESTQCTGNVNIGGLDATHNSSRIFISNSSGAVLTIDRATNTYITNSMFTTFAPSANTLQLTWLGGTLTNDPIILGTNVNVLIANALGTEFALFNAGRGITVH